MTRPSHPGRTSPAVPFATPALAVAARAAERVLAERCRIGTVTTTTEDVPPYRSTTVFTAAASDVPCTVQPVDARELQVVDDPSRVALFDLRVPHGTPLATDQTVEFTAGRNTGLTLKVLDVLTSSTEPLLRASCERITPGEP